MSRKSNAFASGIALALAGGWLVLSPVAAIGQESSSGRALAEKFADQARKVEEAQAASAAEEERAKAEAARIAAEKLAADAKAKADETGRALEQMKRDEAEMLERARAEANAVAEAQRRARERIEQEKAAADKARAEKETAEREAREYTERAARETAEREARLKADAEQRQKEQEAARAVEAEQRQAEAARLEEAHRKALEAEREAEKTRVSVVLRRARAAREALAARRPSTATDPVAKAPQPAPTPPSAATPVAPPLPPEPDAPVIAVTPEMRPTAATAAPSTAPNSTLVTVLLVMDPGTNGIRRFQKTADPILCVRESCYISAGPNEPAIELPRWKAFGTGNTLGKRAGACRNLLACVFRNVDLGDAEALIQPVDMRIMRHDRREPLKVRADQSCTVQEGHLHCATLVASKDWRAWVLPEPVAKSVGVEALQSALKSGLPRSRSAGLGTQ